MSDLYANCCVDITLEELDRPFQYRIPDELRDKVKVGVMVKAPFGRGNRTISAYVMEISDKPSIDKSRIKDLSEVVENRLHTVSDMIELAAWIRHSYGGTMIQALKTVLPVKQKVEAKSIKYATLAVSREEALTYAGEFEKRKTQLLMANILRYMAENSQGSEDKSFECKKLIELSSSSASSLASLNRRGLIDIREERVFRSPILDEIKSRGQEESKVCLEANAEQEEIISKVKADFENKTPKTYLIHGVTGSGKTLTYIEIIDYYVKAGKQVIMLIPEIALTMQTLTRFYARFGERVSIINSKMSAGERYDQFIRAMRGEIDIMIGPRSALFTPFTHLGLIVVDEEHETSYKSGQVPCYNAVETAVHMGKLYGLSVILGSATPSIESYYKAMSGEYQLFSLDKRASGQALPKVYVADMRAELKEGNRTIFSRKLKELMDDRLAKGEQIMLFLNKRGYAGFISCRECGQVIKCPHCDISLTLHRNGKMICHYCGHEQDAYRICPKCGSKYITGIKAGTQKIEEALHTLYPKARILRMDKDTTKDKHGHERILSAFVKHEADILIGTQMIVKGHDFPLVTLAGALMADMSLYTSTYQASERTFQLLVQAAGRAGRDSKPGDVVIQTYSPDNYSIVASQRQDYKAFYDEEISFRSLMKYPPVEHMLTVHISSKSVEKLERACDDLKVDKDLRTSFEDLEIMGPVKQNAYKLDDEYYQTMYIKAVDRERLSDFKDALDLYGAEKGLLSYIYLTYEFD